MSRKVLEALCSLCPAEATRNGIKTRPLELLIVHWQAYHKESQAGDDQRQPHSTGNNEP